MMRVLRSIGFALVLLALPECASAAISTVSALADQTLSSATDAVVTSMELTPGAGDYLAIFTGEIDPPAGLSALQVIVSIYVNGVQVTGSERITSFGGSEDSAAPVLHIAATAIRVTPTAGQVVDVRYRKTGTLNTIIQQRTLSLLPYAAANFSQITDTVTDTLASATETLMDNMTLTPASGDYLAVFSTYVDAATAADVIATMLYVGGTRVGHTERTFTNESSWTGQEFTILIAAKVSPNGSQAVEARWARQAGTGTISAYHRALTLVKMNFSNDLQEASATGDVTSTSTTYEAFSSDLTVSPSADEWLAIFGGSQNFGTIAAGNDQQVDYSVFVAGSQNTNSERGMSHEDSIDATDTTVFTHGVINPTAGQAVNIQWRVVAETSALTRTMRERTLVLVRESDGGGAGPACSQQIALLGVGCK